MCPIRSKEAFVLTGFRSDGPTPEHQLTVLARRVSLPSAELQLMIRASPRPRISGGEEPSASVGGSQHFLRICVRVRTRPPSAHSALDTRLHATDGQALAACWRGGSRARSTDVASCLAGFSAWRRAHVVGRQ